MNGFVWPAQETQAACCSYLEQPEHCLHLPLKNTRQKGEQRQISTGVSLQYQWTNKDGHGGQQSERATVCHRGFVHTDSPDITVMSSPAVHHSNAAQTPEMQCV